MQADSFLSSILTAFAPHKMAARAFAKKRSDYYYYLASVLRSSSGRMTILDIFMNDAERYASKPRGKLTAYWAQQHQENGADLVETWRGTLPDSDLMMMSSAIRTGGPGALEQALEDTARVSGLVAKAKGIFVSTVIVGAFAVALGFGMAYAMPTFFLPTIQESFSFVPLELWGPKGKAMLSFAEFLKSYSVVCLIGIVAFISWVSWSLANYTGPGRAWLDRKAPLYTLYRDFMSATFIATLASMLKKRGNVSMNLREAIEVIKEASNPWMSWHCGKMMLNIEEMGGQSADIFNTGIMQDEDFFFMSDMVRIKGFDEGLRLAGERTEKETIKSIEKKAGVLRWVLLIFGIGMIFLFAGWVTAIMGELKAATTQVFS